MGDCHQLSNEKGNSLIQFSAPLKSTLSDTIELAGQLAMGERSDNAEKWDPFYIAMFVNLLTDPKDAQIWAFVNLI